MVTATYEMRTDNVNIFPDYIFSLTTIPGREKEVASTLATLANQTVRPKEIVVYVPKRFRRRELAGAGIGKLPDYCRIIPVEEDLGPATKILYALREYPGMPIIYCDDDRLYPPRLAESLLQVSQRHPGAAVAANAVPVAQYLMQYSLKKDLAYRVKRILSLGIYKPKRYRRNAFCDIAPGFGGVLVRSSQFDPGVYDIPDIFWLVDDIWLSGNLALGGTKLLGPAPSLRDSDASSESVADPLGSYVDNGLRREDLDRRGIRYFQEKHGIWLNDGGN